MAAPKTGGSTMPKDNPLERYEALELTTLRLRAEAYDELVATEPATAAALHRGVMAHMARRFAKQP
jgi:hypothetical protein